MSPLACTSRLWCLRRVNKFRGYRHIRWSDWCSSSCRFVGLVGHKWYMAIGDTADTHKHRHRVFTLQIVSATVLRLYRQWRSSDCFHICIEIRWILLWDEILVGLARENQKTDCVLTAPYVEQFRVHTPGHRVTWRVHRAVRASGPTFVLSPSRYNTLKCFNLSRHGRRRRKPSSIPAVGAFRCLGTWRCTILCTDSVNV